MGEGQKRMLTAITGAAGFLDATLKLLQALECRPARLIYASSIAVFGGPLPEQVDERTAPAPDTTYGMHKLMSELTIDVGR